MGRGISNPRPPDLERRRQFEGACLGAPPVVVALVVELSRRETLYDVRAAEDGRAGLRVVWVAEGNRIFPFPDVLRQRDDGLRGCARQVLQNKARVGSGQGELDRPVVDCLDRLDPLLDRAGPVELRRILLQHVDGEDDVLRRQRLAVAPLGALPQFDRPLGQVIVVREALRQPAVDLACLIVQHEKGLHQVLVHPLQDVGAGDVRVPDVRSRNVDSRGNDEHILAGNRSGRGLGGRRSGRSLGGRRSGRSLGGRRAGEPHTPPATTRRP